LVYQQIKNFPSKNGGSQNCATQFFGRGAGAHTKNQNPSRWRIMREDQVELFFSAVVARARAGEGFERK